MAPLDAANQLLGDTPRVLLRSKIQSAASFAGKVDVRGAADASRRSVLTTPEHGSNCSGNERRLCMEQKLVYDNLLFVVSIN